jgi:hypothetical protein
MRVIYGFSLLFFLFIGTGAQSQSLFNLGANWKYFKGNTSPSVDWNTEAFDDTPWLTGVAPFQYDYGTNGTVLDDMRYNYTTFYLRKTFNISKADSLFDKVKFYYGYDDAFKVWINGVLVLNVNAPETSNIGDTALTLADEYDLSPDSAIFTAADANIKSGDNTIAVVVYNVNIQSSDIYFDISPVLTTLTVGLPKAPEVTFDKAGGYYSSAFNVVLSSINAGDTLKYTIDCSDPSTSATAKTAISPYILNINPSGMTGRPNTPAVVVRAATIKAGFDCSNSETRTYIFLDLVKTQTNPGSPWPADTYSGQYIVTGVNSNIANDSRYKNYISDAFSSIPTVSVVTENDNLFNKTTGIYMNALLHGDTWERSASLELVNTDNTEAFSSNMGLRIRGGWSRNSWNPKHAFRVFFKDEYGKKKLDYPLFGENAAQSFDKFDLRCAQNYSWSFYNDVLMTYAQDEFFRDVQGLMGQLYTRSEYCHLFLNGMYWGLYEFMERPEANFAESYKGGDKDDYDVIKVATDNYHSIEATDGNLDKWISLVNTFNAPTPINYNQIQGLNTSGEVDTSLTKMVDIDNLIDYMMCIFYGGNFDAPLSQFGDNANPNNFYSIINRNSKRDGFKFIVHDAEHSMVYNAPNQAGNDGVNENRVSLEGRGYIESPSYLKFTPHHVHKKLTYNDNYKLRFADRAYKYLYNNGLFTPTTAETNFRKRANEIDMAIIGESMRWGTRTKDDHWIPAINNTVSQFINLRTPILIDQLNAVGLLGTLDPPAFYYSDETLINTQDVEINSTLNTKITNPNTSGSIYYTIDGSDPRNYNGSLSSKAIAATNNSYITVPHPQYLKARVLDGTKWSPIREVLFTNTKNRDKIRITEIQYNATRYGSVSDNELEFIELKNIGEEGVDLGGCRLDSGIRYTFPKGTIINPKGFVVIASSKNGFEFLYKIQATGEFMGSLANEGEQIVLLDEERNVIIDMTYGGCYPQTNGSGNSLVAKSLTPVIGVSCTNYWTVSKNKWGSPFADDPILNSVESPNVATLICNIYPNPVTESLFITNANTLNAVQIIDLAGKIIYNENISSSDNIFEIPIKSMNLSDGMYIVKLFTESSINVKKVILKK